jgi:hypothetical protein
MRNMNHEWIVDKSEEKPLRTCLIPVEAQPPTFGLIWSIKRIAKNYDEIVVCVRDNPTFINTQIVVEMLAEVLDLPKIMVISHPQNFEEMIEFPQDLPYFNCIATISERIFINLISKNYGCYLIPRALGYDESFHIHAWRQANALDVLRSNIKQIPIKNLKKAETNLEEGE